MKQFKSKNSYYYLKLGQPTPYSYNVFEMLITLAQKLAHTKNY